jgi:3alpha(or 20beta)-hydroxysteroid dehydrogenase
MADLNQAKLAGRTTLVSGSARGLGAAYARALHGAGASVIITDVLVDEGEALQAELGGRALFLRHDVSSSTEWRDVVARGEEAFGPITVLINNAGIHEATMIENYSEERFRRMIDINLTGVFLGMQEILPSMRRGGGGSIVNVSSTAGLCGFPSAIGYIASKWAVRGMTKAAALEFGPDKIRVNSLHPGLIETPMTQAFAPNLAQAIPRAGRMDEVATLVLFLASDDSSYCTGSEFVIDGGQSILVGVPPSDGGD